MGAFPEEWGRRNFHTQEAEMVTPAMGAIKENPVLAYATFFLFDNGHNRN